MQNLLSHLKTQQITSLVKSDCQKSEYLQSIILAYKIEQNPQIIKNIFQCKDRNNEIVFNALNIAKKYEYNNKELVKQIRITQYEYQSRIRDIQKKYLLKFLLFGYGILFTIHLGVQGWYYLEYDVWLSKPQLSDYHINRFR